MRSFRNLLLVAAILLPAVVAAKDDGKKINVIPYPQSVELGKGQFKAAGAIFNCETGIDDRSLKAIREFAGSLTFISGRTSTVAVPGGSIRNAVDEGKIKGFVFLKENSLGPEAYTIEVSSKNCIVKASAFNGFLYAIQTLKQLTDSSIYGEQVDANQKFIIPCIKISDSPRFAYRGLHLDCSRHFIPMEEVIRVLDIMSLYKLNRFHWHLTDDQGWRIEIRKYPKLTSVGAFRNGTMIEGDPNNIDGIRHGGYYTQEQIKEVVEHAASLGIEIIPEIDLPGHMSAAIASYPYLSCHDDALEIPMVWGVFNRTLCPGKEAMFTFLEDVFTEVMDLFPSEYYHIGGDECPKTEWEVCPDCQARIKELGLKSDSHGTAEQRLQNYVTARIQKFLGEHGHKIIGWDEILEGELAPGATVMSWRGTKGGEEASRKGFDVIMTPEQYCYFNQPQAKEGEPYATGILTLDTVYGYNPAEGLDETQQKHLLGVQANMWGEYIQSAEHLEYMLLPRLCAMSEVQWCDPSAKDEARFLKALREESFKIFKNIGYNFRKTDN